MYKTEKLYTDDDLYYFGFSMFFLFILYTLYDSTENNVRLWENVFLGFEYLL